jgi:formylglycine-generating enzyme required for sulfatase activity
MPAMTRQFLPAGAFLWIACAAPLAAQELEDYSQVVLSREIPMVAVPEGEYQATSYLPTEQSGVAANRWQVTVGPFWIGKYELRLGEYREWLQEKDRVPGPPQEQRAHRTLEYNPAESGLSVGCNPREANSDEHPIVGIHQWSAKRYCHWLSMRTGRFYRLPTEAEWEYACRAGNATGLYPWGDSTEELSKYAVTAPPGGFGAFLQLPGTKAANAWGIYDMIGNAEEWVADGFTPIRPPGRGNPIVWPASRKLSQDAKRIWDEFDAASQHYVDGWGVAKGGSHDFRRCQDPRCFTVAARTNPSLLSNHEDPLYPILQDTPRDLMANVGEAVGFRIARPAGVPDRKFQLWHWGVYFDHERWQDLTLEPTDEIRR